MKSSLIVTSLLAALALAKPLEKRFIVTEVEWTTCVVTVTAGAPPPGPAPDDSQPAPQAPKPAEASTTPAAYQPHHGGAAPDTAPAQTSAGYAPAQVTTAPSTGDSYSQAILDQHNNHRANHSVPALTWSDDMASIAAQIAASCVYAHNVAAGGGGYGQNIGAGAAPADVPGMITNEMYDNEIGFFPKPYGQSSPDMSNFEQWGHFSQIVWKGTTSVGCATQYCPGGLANTGSGVSPYFTVCNYSPPGNYAGEYGDNVLAPQGEASVFIST